MSLVFTNGCFDILHIGHVNLFKYARSLGDTLIVGVNGDASVRKLKGPKRPINNQFNRREIVRSIRYVDDAIIFHEEDVCRIMEILKPSIWVKGGDYTLETLNPKEVKLARELNCEIKLFPIIKGVSTTKLLSLTGLQ